MSDIPQWIQLSKSIAAITNNKTLQGLVDALGGALLRWPTKSPQDMLYLPVSWGWVGFRVMKFHPNRQDLARSLQCPHVTYPGLSICLSMGKFRECAPLCLT